MFLKNLGTFYLMTPVISKIGENIKERTTIETINKRGLIDIKLTMSSGFFAEFVVPSDLVGNLIATVDKSTPITKRITDITIP